MLPENKIVRGVWIGDRLSPIQQLCIRSFQDHGHEFHLYVHEDLLVPAGTVIHGIDEIVPVADRQRFNCTSHFSDWFRVNLIYKTGGWYVDLDEVCLKPFDFPEPYVFVSEYPDRLINGCIFKAPEGCALLLFIINSINGSDTLNAEWIALGPQKFRDFVPRCGLNQYVKPPEVFDGLAPRDHASFAGNGRLELDKRTYSFHLRTSFWTKERGLDPFAKYPDESLFEKLKRQHGVENV